jgi:hypothetical protein
MIPKTAERLNAQDRQRKILTIEDQLDGGIEDL